MNIKIAENQAEFFGCMLVRAAVFVKEQQVDIDLELDQDDLTCRHFCLMNEDKQVIGTCRVLAHDDVAHIGRVAILKEYRKQGLGARMLRHVEEECRQIGFTKMELGAQLHALPFYEKLGFIPYGEVFMDASIPHKMMEKVL